MTTIRTLLTTGGQAAAARVECLSEPGIGLHVVGLPVPSAVKECLLRVATVLQGAGCPIPGRKILIRITPSLPKDADPSGLDLPVALTLLAESRGLALPDNVCAFGQLGLDGSVRAFGGSENLSARAREAGLLTEYDVVCGPGTTETFTEAVRRLLGN